MEQVYKVVINKDGTFWYNEKGQFHRENGPAAEYVDTGSKYWYLNGKYHREDGPACEYHNGEKTWYINGQRHREDGPALEWANGNKKWYLNGKEYSETEFNQIMAKKKRPCVGKTVIIDDVEYTLE